MEPLSKKTANDFQMNNKMKQLTLGELVNASPDTLTFLMGWGPILHEGPRKNFCFSPPLVESVNYLLVDRL